MNYQSPQPQKAPRKPRVNLYKLGAIRLPWHTALVVCAALLLMGWSLANLHDINIKNLHDKIDEANNLVYQKEREVLTLTEQVRLSTTDQFIASEARIKYGYLFPGEIRFVVTNPEVLGLPPRNHE